MDQLTLTSATTIKLYLVHGQADGLRTAEISNWSGKAIAGPRSDLSSLRQRKELAAPGVYFLVGEDEDTGRRKIYVGEAENVADRLGSKKHANRDFWVTAVAFVSKDHNLTKAHIKYFEGRLIVRGKELDLLLDNSQGSGAALPESDAADMEYFLLKIYQLLPVLGVRYFESPQKVSENSDDWLFCSIKNLRAKGRRTPTGFIVMQNSDARFKL